MLPVSKDVSVSWDDERDTQLQGLLLHKSLVAQF